jgi:proline racemase
VRGDVAWGGNWFFLVADHGLRLEASRTEELSDFARRVRRAVNAAGFPEVDHVELLDPPGPSGSHARNFVLCPGNAYDRSPCGTGTSAKLACLAADGRLAEHADWVQEGILGTVFTGRYRWEDRAAGSILPEITGAAHVIAESTLLIDPLDPFAHGICPHG